MGATPPDGNGMLYGSSPLGGSGFGSAFGSSASRRSGSLLGSSPPTGRLGQSLGTSVPLPKFQHPSHALLEQNGFKQIKYYKYYQRCLEDRTNKGEGSCLHVVSMIAVLCCAPVQNIS